MDNLFGNPERSRVKWKISGKWARKPINCTLSGIVNECHGCCELKPGWSGPKMYPMRAFHSDRCGFYIPGKGCSFSIQDRPLACLLYPFVLNPSKTFVINGRALITSCKHAYKTQSTTIFEHFKDIWIEIFGVEQFDRVYQDLIVNMKDESFFYPSDRIIKIMSVEAQRELNNEKPTNRNEIL